MKRNIILTIALVVFVLAGAFYMRGKAAYENAPSDTSTDVVRERATLTGSLVCLPHRDQTGPQTKECMRGLKDDASGAYYVVDLNLMSQTAPDLQVGDRISASGLITPIEMLSTDMWQKYLVEGIFSVTDSLREI